MILFFSTTLMTQSCDSLFQIPLNSGNQELKTDKSINLKCWNFNGLCYITFDLPKDSFTYIINPDSLQIQLGIKSAIKLRNGIFINGKVCNGNNIHVKEGNIRINLIRPSKGNKIKFKMSPSDFITYNGKHLIDDTIQTELLSAHDYRISIKNGKKL